MPRLLPRLILFPVSKNRLPLQLMRFSEIKGNDEIKVKLLRTVLEQRVAHAQLFYGPEGNNKLALAIAYAQFINCTNKQGIPGPGTVTAGRAAVETPGLFGSHDDPTLSGGLQHPDSCGTCPSCVKYQKIAHPDLHFIFPVSTTKKVTSKPRSKYFSEDWRAYLLQTRYKVSLLGWYESIGIENKQGIINADDCNDIITTLGYKSYESEYKVMIIFMAEKIFYSAAPKILKILEEPPDKTLFLLISEQPDQILKTILSRTLMVRIPGTDQESWLPDTEGSEHFVQFRQWMRDCFAGKVAELVAFSNDIAKAGREKQKSFLIYSMKVMALCLGMNLRGEKPINLDEEQHKFITGFAPYIDHQRLTVFNTLLNDAIYHIERNTHAPTLFLDLSLKIVQQFKPNLLPLR